MGYPTPSNDPAELVCRVIFIPNDVNWLATVTGALNQLIYPYSWEQYGTLTPEQCAARFLPLFQDFCLNKGVCRVIGEIIQFAGDTSPNVNWLICDGASLLRADYPDLFTVIGTTYGAVDGTHFNLPDLRGRTVIGAGTGTGLSPRTVGDSLGEETHQLSVGELAAHVHSTGNSLSSLAVMPGEGPVLTPNPLPATTGSTGSDTAHNNMQPSLCLNYLIVARD